MYGWGIRGSVETDPGKIASLVWDPVWSPSISLMLSAMPASSKNHITDKWDQEFTYSAREHRPKIQGNNSYDVANTTIENTCWAALLPFRFPARSRSMAIAHQYTERVLLVIGKKKVEESASQTWCPNAYLDKTANCSYNWYTLPLLKLLMNSSSSRQLSRRMLTCL